MKALSDGFVSLSHPWFTQDPCLSGITRDSTGRASASIHVQEVLSAARPTDIV